MAVPDQYEHQDCYLLDKKSSDDGISFQEDHRIQKYHDYYIERLDVP